jgi:pyruvate dehydrogenase E1 component beta subunit
MAVRSSVEKTGRCVIVHEAPLSVGLGAEIAADLAEHCLTSLLAPIRRVTGFDTVMPYSRLESYYLPTTARIVKAVHDVMEYA